MAGTNPTGYHTGNGEHDPKCPCGYGGRFVWNNDTQQYDQEEGK
jgi:hypothetical protein